MSVNIYQNGNLNPIAGQVSVDAELSKTSTNAVQNKVVSEALGKCPVGVSTLGTASATPRDADTLGGKYTSSDIDTLNENLTKYTKSAFCKITAVFNNDWDSNPISLSSIEGLPSEITSLSQIKCISLMEKATMGACFMPRIANNNLYIMSASQANCTVPFDCIVFY